MTKLQEYSVIVSTTVLVILIMILTGLWVRYAYRDCLKVGHSKTYCLVDKL